MNKNNSSISGILGYYFKLEMMVPQRDNEAPKTPERLLISLPVTIPSTQNNTEVRDIKNSREEPKKKVTHNVRYQAITEVQEIHHI